MHLDPRSGADTGAREVRTAIQQAKRRRAAAMGMDYSRFLDGRKVSVRLRGCDDDKLTPDLPRVDRLHHSAAAAVRRRIL